MSKNHSFINRREFIKRSSFAIGGITLAACSDLSTEPVASDLPESPGLLELNGLKLKIIIVGAGIAGLTAAYELKRAGHNVKVLEASDRIGGRIFTIKNGFDEGQFAEAGASRIPPHHDLTLGYINHFGLSLENFYPRKNNYFFLSGKSRSIIDTQTFLSQSPWPGSVPHNDYQKIVGGNDMLPMVLGQYLGKNILLNSQVKTIEQNNSGVFVKTIQGKEFSGDKLLCAVPPTVLLKISFSPSLSSEKLRIRKVGYDYVPSSRIFIQFHNRFWLNNNLNGWGTSNLPEEIWQPTFNQKGETGIILTYLRGEIAKLADRSTLLENQLGFITRMGYVYENPSEYLYTSSYYSWQENEWIKAAYAAPTEDQRNELQGVIAKTEGRIYFAGEHDSSFHGWIQGAIKSGLRAANEIHNKQLS